MLLKIQKLNEKIATDFFKNKNISNNNFNVVNPENIDIEFDLGIDGNIEELTKEEIFDHLNSLSTKEKIEYFNYLDNEMITEYLDTLSASEITNLFFFNNNTIDNQDIKRKNILNALIYEWNDFKSSKDPHKYTSEFYGNGIDAEWCAVFEWYIANYKTNSNNYKQESVFHLMSDFENDNKLHYSKEDYNPKAGDTLFFDWENNGLNPNYEFKNEWGQIDHTGFVFDVKGDKIYTLEGNSGSPSAVRIKVYDLDDSRIIAYGEN